MINAGPLGQIAALVVAAGGAFVALWALSVLWEVWTVLLAMGWPLLLLAPAALASGALCYRHTLPGRPALPSVERYCDACGNRLRAGRCTYCDGV